jgi:hypothetical protein
MSPFFQPVYQGFPGFAQDQAVFFFEVIRMHLQFNGLPDQSIQLNGFGGQKFGVM